MIERKRSVVLVECLGRLTAPAERQVDYLAGLGVGESADELGLEFDDVYRPLKNLLVGGPELTVAAGRLRELDEALGEDALGWTVEDLWSSDVWQEIRRLAAAALQALAK